MIEMLSDALIWGGVILTSFAMIMVSVSLAVWAWSFLES